MKKLNTALFVSFLALSATVNAQTDDQDDSHTIGITIPEVALVDIESSGSKNITMDFTAPTEAGLPIVAPTNNTALWLNYSSIKSTTDVTRTISVKLDALIAGVDIKVTAGAAASTGDGTKGTPSSQLTLTAADQTIISGIGSAYTGNGASNGHNLTYELAFGTTGAASYADLQASSNTATVTYTISDN